MTADSEKIAEPNRRFLLARSTLFYLGFSGIVACFSTLVCLLAFLPLHLRQTLATTGNALIMAWLRICCGISIKAEGLGNIPVQPCVFLSNHQSTWETFYLQRLLRPACTILKKELLYIPFFGWGLSLMHPIAIDRTNPRDATRQVLTGGRQRLAEGNSVIIYPQGTRVPYGESKPYARSGAALALDAGVPVVPVAHNAGAHWPNDEFLKYPGTIRVVFGAPITDAGNSKQLTTEVQSWIEAQQAGFG